MRKFYANDPPDVYTQNVDQGDHDSYKTGQKVNDVIAAPGAGENADARGEYGDAGAVCAHDGPFMQ